MTVASGGATYRLPDGSTPVLLTSGSPELLRGEAAAILSYAQTHPDVSPRAIAQMLFRTRIVRKHRALAIVDDRKQLLDALRAVAGGHEHAAVITAPSPAAARKFAFVFPGQGSQRPGMGRLFYDTIPAFRAEADRCAQAFAEYSGQSPLNYLLDEQLTVDGNAGTVQPALFTQMAGLAATWKSFGIAPHATVGHSQGEIAAAYVSGLITLRDAVRIIGIRAHAADGIDSGDYAMAVVATGRENCEDLLARCSGWAELSAVNSPHMTGISGDRDTVEGIVEALTERGVFARVIGVQYPAHTSLINRLGDRVRMSSQSQLENPKFLDSEIDCLGATLGGPITQDLPVDQYWFWNLRNTVRFDKAIAAAAGMGADTFVELAEHPTLQLAIQENLGVLKTDGVERRVVGTSQRTATDLGEFTRNLAQLAAHDLNYAWDALRVDSDGPPALPLPDFPNTLMNATPLWLPYDEVLPRRTGNRARANAQLETAPAVEARAIPPRLLAEDWVRLTRHSLTPPRTIGIVDHTGECADLTGALRAAAAELGAPAGLIGSDFATSDFDTQVILLPRSPEMDVATAVEQVATFFADRAWWPGVGDTVTNCWLVTVGGESVVDDDAPPDLLHAAASAGFRSIGAKYPGVRFRHLDLPPGAAPGDAARSLLKALHTDGESELALRNGALYAKRIVAGEASIATSSGAKPGHVLIIGGTGKLGLEFCSYFAQQQGIRRVTLVSRSGETPANADRLRQIRSGTGTEIRVVTCDLGDEASVAQLAEQHRDTPADLIIHAAVEYSGVELEDITAAKVDTALGAKVVGISRVLDTFPKSDGCRVLLCSSVSATVGGRGLALYAAGNRMLDAMADHLRAKGLDCVAVQWGHWKVHLDDSGLAMLANIGVVAMPPAEALAVGMTRLAKNAAVVAFDLERARSVLETCGRGSLLSQLSLPAALAPAVNPAPSAGVSQRLLSLLAGAIGIDSVDTIDTTIPMVAIGLDSLQALEFRRRVKTEFDHELEVGDLLGGASIADVLAKLGA